MAVTINSIKSWLAKQRFSSKTIASVWVVIVGMWYTQPAFHDYVLSVYGSLPKGLHGLIAGVVVPALLFWKSQKAIEVVAADPPAQLQPAQKPPLK